MTTLVEIGPVWKCKFTATDSLMKKKPSVQSPSHPRPQAPKPTPLPLSWGGVNVKYSLSRCCTCLHTRLTLSNFHVIKGKYIRYLYKNIPPTYIVRNIFLYYKKKLITSGTCGWMHHTWKTCFFSPQPDGSIRVFHFRFTSSELLRSSYVM